MRPCRIDRALFGLLPDCCAFSLVVGGDEPRKIVGSLWQFPANGESEIGKAEYDKIREGKPIQCEVIAIIQRFVEPLATRLDELPPQITENAAALALRVSAMPNLQLRGLMAKAAE